MAEPKVFIAVALLGVAAALTCVPVQAAQAVASGSTIAGPDYGEDGNYRTPAADGRPGVYYFDLGAAAFRKGDFRHALDMYKVAASWAYKPAEYNLGLMYFKGQGITVDRARGAAWMILAAERNAPLYVKARDLMVTLLTKEQFQRTDEIWNQLKPVYGDAVALRRAKAQWARARNARTGSHLGHGADNLRVGVPSGTAAPSATKAGGAAITDVNGALLTGGASEDGSAAYRAFSASDNPYSPIYLKNRKGKVTVESLQPIEPAATPHGSTQGGLPQLPPPGSAQQDQ